MPRKHIAGGAPEMDGSDLPPGGSGSRPARATRKRQRGATDAAAPSSSPGIVTRRSARSTKRKCGAADTAGPSSPGIVTRSSARASAVLRWARRKAEGALWATPVRDRADQVPMREAILCVRRERSVLAPDDPASPYTKPRAARASAAAAPRARPSLPGAVTRRRRSLALAVAKTLLWVRSAATGTLWTSSDRDLAPNDPNSPYIKEKSPKFRTPGIRCSIKTRQAGADNCNCQHPGSEACVRVHAHEAKCFLENQLSKKLHEMTKQALSCWTKEDVKKLDDIEKSVPPNKPSEFMTIALEKFGAKKQNDLVSYYYNVFLPRRWASSTRAETENARDVGKDDDRNEDHSEKKKTSSTSSKRSTK